MKIFQDLDPNCFWLIKWIDRFQLGHYEAESPLVNVILERLPEHDLDKYTKASAERVSYILGKPPWGGEQTDRKFSRQLVLAGYLPLMRIGNIVRGGKIIGHLPSRSIDVIAQEFISEELRCSSIREAPEGWGKEFPYYLLNNYELSRGEKGGADLRDARCLVLKRYGLDIIIPKIVIFRAFYGFHSKLVHAFCRGPWERTAKDVISLKRYESGIETAIDEQTQDWKIVLEMGVPSLLVPQIALLWFDPYARSLANLIHTDSQQQAIEARQKGELPSWLINAKIPHATGQDDRTFRMSLSGYYLRPHKKYKNDDKKEIIRPSKFLVHTITAYSWSMPDQKILWEIANSNETGSQPSETREDKPYLNKPPVAGSPDAVGTSNEAPDSGSTVNVFEAEAPRLLGEPKLERQQKHSSKKYPGSATIVSEGPDSVVSVAEPIHGDDRPSQAVIEGYPQRSTELFAQIIAALERLKHDGEIEGYSPIPASGFEVRGVGRAGLPCWSLDLSAPEGRTSKSGWSVIFRSSTSRRQRDPRALLVLHIRIQGRDLILMEIEPRPTESAYRMYMYAGAPPLDSFAMAHMMKGLCECEGSASEEVMQEIFRGLSASLVHSFKHRYVYEDGGNKVITGIRKDLLLKNFQKTISPDTNLL